MTIRELAFKVHYDDRINRGLMCTYVGGDVDVHAGYTFSLCYLVYFTFFLCFLCFIGLLEEKRALWKSRA
jgi:hypothetical protein